MAPSSTNEVDQRDLYRLADELARGRPNLRELLKIPLGTEQIMGLVDGFERKLLRGTRVFIGEGRSWLAMFFWI